MAITRDDVTLCLPLDNTYLDYAQNNTVTVNGTPDFTTDIPSGNNNVIGSLDLDGSTDYLALGTSLLGNAAFSIMGRFKADAVNNNYYIIGRNASLIVGPWSGGTNEFVFRIYNGSTWTSVVKSFSDTASWHSFKVSWDGSSTMSLQIDNDTETTGTQSSMAGTGNTLHVGAYNPAGDGRYFDGHVRDIWFFNRVVTTTEYSDFHNSGAPKTWTDYFGLDDGLKYYYSLNTDGTDSTGTTNLAVSGATNTTGYLSNGMSFDGTNDYLNGTLTIPASFTIAFWLKANEAVPTTRDRILALNDDSTPYIYLDHKNSSGNLECYVTSSGGNAKYFDTGYSSTDWNHIVIRYDSTSDSLYYFKNGVAVIAGGSEVGTSAWAGATGNFQLGIAWDLSTYPFNGYLDEFGIWERALTAGEVKRLYNYGCGRTYTEITGSESPLLEGNIDFYNLDGDATSSRGRMPDGTVNGATSAPTSGIVDGCYAFDGTNDNIRMGDVEATDPGTGAFSVMGWAKTSDTAGTYKYIVSKSAATAAPSWEIRIKPTGEVQGMFRLSTLHNTITSVTTVDDGAWHMTLLTRPDSGGNVKLYIDDETALTLANSAYNVSNSLNFAIGEHDNNTFSMLGDIDAVGAWNRELRESERNALYNSGAGLQYPFTPATPPVSTANSMFFGGGF